jgi:hypothetical protein
MNDFGPMGHAGPTRRRGPGGPTDADEDPAGDHAADGTRHGRRPTPDPSGRVNRPAGVLLDPSTSLLRYTALPRLLYRPPSGQISQTGKLYAYGTLPAAPLPAPECPCFTCVPPVLREAGQFLTNRNHADTVCQRPWLTVGRVRYSTVTGRWSEASRAAGVSSTSCARSAAASSPVTRIASMRRHIPCLPYASPG